MRPTARSLILDLLSTLKRGSMPVRALVSAGVLFGIAGNGVRVALARLLAEGLVERDERGQYRLGPRSDAVREQVQSWRQVERQVRDWDGGWVGVHTAAVPRGRARARRRHERALRLLGFRTLATGLALRPDNLAGGAGAVRERLLGLGLAPEALVARLDALDPAADLRARSLWDAAGLVRAYRRLRAELAESEARLAGLDAAEAQVETFLLGGRGLRQIVLDPLLPEPLVPRAERRALVEAMRRYDRIGRACWAEFLRGFGVPHRSAPLDRSVFDAAGRNAASAGGMA